MSLPPLLLFEYHWDPLPKQLVQTLLPELTDLGYNTYCLEAPEDVSYPDLKQRYIEGLQSDEKISSDAQQLLAKRKIIVKEQDLIDMSYDKLSKLMNQFVSSQVVSSQGFKYVAEHIKGLPVTRLMGYLFNQMEELSIDIKPIDLGSKDHDTMMSKNDPSERMNLIKKNEVRRIATMSKNILQLYKEGRGVIFLCGALHASNLITALKKSGLDNIVYYFVYPSKRYVDSLDNVQLSLDNNAASDKENGNKELTLEGHTQLLTESTIAPFSRKVIQQILPQIRYIKQIQGGNSHSQFLSSLFVAPFVACLRPGFHVDALVNIDDYLAAKFIEVLSSEEQLDPTLGLEQLMKDSPIVKEMGTKGIQTHVTFWNHHWQLVIPNVNDARIGRKLRELNPC